MNQKVESILDVFSTFRMQPLATDEYEAKGKQVLREKLTVFIEQNTEIKFSMLGFPFKSPNHRDKTIGNKPDMAEQATMENFANFSKRIQEVYNPGIKLNIVSDGLAFSDVMEVETKVVDEYRDLTLGMAEGIPLNILTLRDFYSTNSLNTMREKMISQFGITNEELERRILFDPDVNMLYKGMIRFMNLDLAIKDYSSNTQLQKAAKIMAREMMFRNEAFSKLVQTEMSDHIRLSMHPSVNNGTKFSFQLINSELAWTSAWHCALLITKDGKYATIHKKDAEAQGFELINNYYYQEK